MYESEEAAEAARERCSLTQFGGKFLNIEKSQISPQAEGGCLRREKPTSLVQLHTASEHSSEFVGHLDYEFLPDIDDLAKGPCWGGDVPCREIELATPSETEGEPPSELIPRKRLRKKSFKLQTTAEDVWTRPTTRKRDSDSTRKRRGRPSKTQAAPGLCKRPRGRPKKSLDSVKQMLPFEGSSYTVCPASNSPY